MKYNLEEIPERFHPLFLIDWNNGNESEVSSLQRGEFNQLQLEYNKWSIKQAINKSKPIDEPFQGGFDDLKSFL
jgi:uncharacterized protein YecA (UPF0149 family)